MINILKIFLVLMLVSSTACAQNINKEMMLGEWMYSGGKNQQGMVECPDVLALYENGEYTIFNDCYGDAASPVIETGKWSAEEKENKILLAERKFTIDYYRFHGSSEKLSGHVKDISNNKMIVCFGEKKECTEEVYKRINP